jgi:heme/copper-type cytochrome/quinol oxidase subunit 1
VTVTETPASAAPEEEAPAVVAPVDERGFAALLGSGDPSSIGKLFIGTSLLFLLVAAVLGELVAIERVDTSTVDLLDNSLAQVTTLHAIAGVFLVGLPLVIGILAAVVPLQIGASTVAFPRALAASYWTYLVSGGLIFAAYSINGGPFGGDREGVDLFVAAFIALVGALCLAAVVLATTVITLRAPGMSLRRAPLLAWATLVSSVVWLLTLPVLAGLMLLVYVDHRYGRLFVGGNEVLYRHIAWVFFQPTIYAFVIPALGMIGDIVPVFARRRHQLHGAAMTAIGLFGVLAIGAWTQTSVTVTGTTVMPWLYEYPWSVVSFAAVLPVLVLAALWADTLRLGKPAPGSPLLFAVGALVMLLAGVAAGALGTIDGITNTLATWQVGMDHYIVLAIVLAAFGALSFWAPKIYGALLPERPAQLLAALALVGSIVLALPDLIAGLVEQTDVDTIETLNAVSAAGGALVAAVAVAFIFLLLATAVRSSDGPGDDPWAGHTLEWTTSSPPPVGNFASLPAITSEAPLYDARHADAEVSA